MSNPCDREGSFRGTIIEYGVSEAESGAVGIALRVKLEEIWSGSEWEPWAQYDMEAEGTIYVIQRTDKGGGISELGAKSLMTHAGWDGNFESVTNGTWQTTPVQVAIKRDDYKDRERFRIAFVNDYERKPGVMSNVSPEKAKALAARYGAQFRALSGNVARNNVPGSLNGPEKPPPPTTKPAGMTPPPVAATPEETIPF